MNPNASDVSFFHSHQWFEVSGFRANQFSAFRTQTLRKSRAEGEKHKKFFFFIPSEQTLPLRWRGKTRLTRSLSYASSFKLVRIFDYVKMMHDEGCVFQALAASLDLGKISVLAREIAQCLFRLYIFGTAAFLRSSSIETVTWRWIDIPASNKKPHDSRPFSLALAHLPVERAQGRNVRMNGHENRQQQQQCEHP